MPPEEDPTQRADRTSRGTTDTHYRAQVYLRQLAERLDPPSFDLLLKILSGVNAAFARRDQSVDLAMTDEERALYTPELRDALTHLLELAGFRRPMMLAGIAEGPVEPPAPEAHSDAPPFPDPGDDPPRPPTQARLSDGPHLGPAGRPDAQAGPGAPDLAQPTLPHLR